MNNNNVYYENNTWHHNTKNLHDGTILYGKKGGFQSEKQAQQAYNRHIKLFETKIA